MMTPPVLHMTSISTGLEGLRGHYMCKKLYEVALEGAV